jgi:hypothetical protein
MVTLEETLQEAQKNNRVCPQPKRWQELYELLPEKKRKGNKWDPAVPPILAAWWDTPALLKVLRMREHIEWASKHDYLDNVYRFLSELPESEWHHAGD